MVSHARRSDRSANYIPSLGGGSECGALKRDRIHIHLQEEQLGEDVLKLLCLEMDPSAVPQRDRTHIHLQAGQLRAGSLELLRLEVALSATRQPGTQATRDPGTGQPGTRQPGTGQPGTGQPGTFGFYSREGVYQYGIIIDYRYLLMTVTLGQGGNS